MSRGGLPVRLTLQENRLYAVDLPDTAPPEFDAAALSDLLAELNTYSLAFDDAPPFYRTVWERMRAIPAGSALTYRELAEAIGNPRAVRAVGQACGANRLVLVIPCHRVLASSGLGGFRLGLPWKQRLLELESEFASLR